MIIYKEAVSNFVLEAASFILYIPEQDMASFPKGEEYK